MYTKMLRNRICGQTGVFEGVNHLPDRVTCVPLAAFREGQWVCRLSLSPTPLGRSRRASFLFSLPLSCRFPSAARSLDATD